MNVVGTKILVEEIVSIEEDGVLLPDNEEIKQGAGRVIKFGTEIPEELKLILSSAPEIKFKKFYDGEEVIINQKEFIVMDYKDILVIL